MGTGDERRQGPGSRAVPAAARLRAREGDGVRVDAPRPQSDGGAQEPPQPPRAESAEPRCQLRTPGPGRGPRGAGQRERSPGAPPSAGREGVFPAPGAWPARPAPSAGRSPPPVTSSPVAQVHPGPLPRAAPEHEVGGSL
ncbi:proline-rich proteoglycan 2-like [Cebus imitator]|uniref:proline-rich proteoglycan 2-like n=1 Tax=Cebus imitator TaxID=2715852 RepID=UPI00080A304D|nr:proline-rich proteoglycan 2-like [Cebus imitator]